jgi:hypothetical protein
MAMVYAAKDTRVRRLISIAGADTGETIRELQRNPAYAEDQTVLPFYRALKRSKAADVTFLVYHADHQFGAVRERLASDMRDWLMQHGGR